MTKLFTIGGYGHTEESFLNSLTSNNINLFVDVRQRRGMRGSLYAFLNAKKLEENLSRIGISYIHLKNLAPTSKVRDLQKVNDHDQGTSKRNRDKLSQKFIDAYEAEVLNVEDQQEIITALNGYSNVCFFCVERHHEACHRSILTNWLEPKLGKAEHI